MSLITRAAFSGIRRGFRFRVPNRVRVFEQHCRTIEEIQRRNVNLVLDVGANVGFYSQHLRQLGYRGLIMAFEPIAESFAELEKKAKGDPHWQVFNFALGATSGTMNFHVMGDDGVLSSALSPILDMPVRKTSVPVRTIGDVLSCLSLADKRIFLKMDTQGYDLEVFKGAGDLPQIVLLQSELSVLQLYDNQPTYADALQAYVEAGFELLETYPILRTASGGIGEMDALMGR